MTTLLSTIALSISTSHPSDKRYRSCNRFQCRAGSSTDQATMRLNSRSTQTTSHQATATGIACSHHRRNRNLPSTLLLSNHLKPRCLTCPSCRPTLRTRRRSAPTRTNTVSYTPRLLHLCIQTSPISNIISELHFRPSQLSQLRPLSSARHSRLSASFTLRP